MSQLNAGEVFTDTSPGKTLTSTRLNNHVNGGTLLNGAVLDQAEKTTPLATDTLLLGDSTQPNSGAPCKVQIGNLLLESQRNGTQQYVGSDTGSANAYAVALTPAATAYTAGMVVRFKAGNTNTGISTVNVNGLGVKAIKNRAGADLAANDILASAVVELIYDGTNFQWGAAISAGEITATMTTENLREGICQYAADGGGANAYAVTLAPVPTAYTAGMVVRTKIANTNTGASTLNVNALGVKTIKKVVAGAVADLVARDLQAADLATLVYDGTYFILTGHVRSWDFVATAQTVPVSNGHTDVAHGLGTIPTKWRVVLYPPSSTENSYAALTEVGIEYFQTGGGSNGFSVSADATNISIAAGTYTSMQVIPYGGAAFANITVANWKIKVYASL